MIKSVDDIDPEKNYILVSGEENFKDGVTNGFRVTLHDHLSHHGGVEGKGVVKVLMIGESEEAKQTLSYYEGAAFQNLHQHWLDTGDVELELHPSETPD